MSKNGGGGDELPRLFIQNIGSTGNSAGLRHGAAAARAEIAVCRAGGSAVRTGAARSGDCGRAAACVARLVDRTGNGRGGRVVAAGRHLLIRAGRLREQGQAEKFIAYRFRKFLRRGHLAEAVGGHHDIHFRQYLQDDAYADRDFKGAVADVIAGDANRARKAFKGERQDRIVRNAEQYVAIDAERRLTHPFLAPLIDEQHVDRHVNRAFHARKLRPVAKALDAEVRDVAARGRGTAGFERPLTARLRQRAGTVFRILDRFFVGNSRTAGRAGAGAAVILAGAAALLRSGRPAIAAGKHGNDIRDRDLLFVELLLRKAAVVNVFDLQAYALVQTRQDVALYHAGTARGIGVLIGIKRKSQHQIYISYTRYIRYSPL